MNFSLCALASIGLGGLVALATTTSVALGDDLQSPEPAGQAHHEHRGHSEHGARGEHEHGGHRHDEHRHDGHSSHQHSEHSHAEGSHHGEGHGMQHDFSDVDRWVAAFEGDDRNEWQKPQAVVDLMGVEPGMTVADLGAGTGYLLPYLAHATGPAGKVLALDPEPNLVEFMKERVEREALTSVEARLIPFDDPQIEAGTAHRILIVNTWHHIGDREVYSAKLLEALAPGGAVYVVDFTKESPRGPSVDHRLPPERVIEEMSAGGLQAGLVKEDLPWQYVVVGRRPGS